MISRLSTLDGRWFLGGSHLTLLIVSIFYFNLARSPFQIVTAYAAAILVELALHRMTGKTKHRSAWDVIFSAATEAAGLLILVKLPNPYAYAMMSAVAVASKYFLRIDEKRHAFNPTNFAIVAALIFTPNELIEIRPDEFIPLAEQSGLVRPLTDVVLRRSLDACASWRARGRPTNREWPSGLRPRPPRVRHSATRARSPRSPRPESPRRSAQPTLSSRPDRPA